jgi:hypothetical protein
VKVKAMGFTAGAGVDRITALGGQTIQFLGGVGFAWEYDPHIYLTRLKTPEQCHGSTAWHIENALANAPLMEA